MSNENEKKNVETDVASISEGLSEVPADSRPLPTEAKTPIGDAPAESPALARKAVSLAPQTSGNYVFSNRTHMELLFSDLGFALGEGRSDPLVFSPYETKDLEEEGFEAADILKSKNLRKFIQSGKMKQGLLEEKDKLPETTLFSRYPHLGDDVMQQSIPFAGEYFKKYNKFVEDEAARVKLTEIK